MWNKIKMLYLSYRYPENVWYGRKGLSLDHSLSCVGPGWHTLIHMLYQAKPKKVRVVQVKEKYGTLHFYVGRAPKWYLDLIDYYELKSSRTCERCGAEGKLREDRSWILTLCDSCSELDKTEEW